MSRLGWIDAPRASRAQWPELATFAAAVREEGLTRVLLCGMGGSSLAPAVLAQAFGATAFDVLDSTDPGAVLDAERGLGVGVWAALAGGLVFMLSGYFVSHLYAGHVNYVWAYPWIPAVLWSRSRSVPGSVRSSRIRRMWAAATRR